MKNNNIKENNQRLNKVILVLTWNCLKQGGFFYLYLKLHSLNYTKHSKIISNLVSYIFVRYKSL